MKIQVMSDLHNEFMYSPRVILKTDADVIVLAGDIDVGLKGVKWAIDISKAHNKPVIYVFGNHEYYHQYLPNLMTDAKYMTIGTNVHLLENDVFIYKNVRFLGATLWTDFYACGKSKQLEAMDYCQHHMSDYEVINHGGLMPYNILDIHKVSLVWLKKQLSTPFQGKTVIISHHAPSLKSCHYELDLMSAGFVNKLDKLMYKYCVNLWIHGHTHEVDDYMIGSTRVVSNQFGYFGGQEVWKFNPALVIKI